MGTVKGEPAVGSVRHALYPSGTRTFAEEFHRRLVRSHRLTCHPRVQAVSAVAAWGAGLGSVLAAGLRGGQVALLDRRAGRLLCNWDAHPAALSGVLCREHQLVTASQVLPLRQDKLASVLYQVAGDYHTDWIPSQ